MKNITDMVLSHFKTASNMPIEKTHSFYQSLNTTDIKAMLAYLQPRIMQDLPLHQYELELLYWYHDYDLNTEHPSVQKIINEVVAEAVSETALMLPWVSVFPQLFEEI